MAKSEYFLSMFENCTSAKRKRLHIDRHILKLKTVPLTAFPCAALLTLFLEF